MEGPTDNNSDLKTDGSEPAGAGQLPDANRRRFSRNAIMGSAVVLSLGNRAAWGQTIGCMSVMTLESFNPDTGFASAHPGRLGHDEDLARQIHEIGAPPTYLGSRGGLSTCQDPNSIDGVCLVEGSCSGPTPPSAPGAKSRLQLDLLQQ
mgnify:CR=1 FL=1